MLYRLSGAASQDCNKPIQYGLMQVADAATAPARQHRVHWWKEAIIVAVFYAVYSWTRNLFGSNKIAADGMPEQAFTNAERIIDLELWLGLFHEQTIQSWFLPYHGFIQFWNTYYGTAHFVITLGVFILLFVKRSDVFPHWRNTLAAMTALAIIGFAWFPLMPPRLLDEPCPLPAPVAEAIDRPVSYGGACIESDLRPADGFGFVDTLAEYGGPWSFDSDTMASISNQYAAMPSLHIGWSTWCALAVWPLLRRPVDEGARAAVSVGHAVLHRRHRQPLLARRRRRTARVRRRSAHRLGPCQDPSTAGTPPVERSAHDAGGHHVTPDVQRHPTAVGHSVTHDVATVVSLGGQ